MFYAVVCFNAIVKRGEPGLCREAALYKLAVIIIIINYKYVTITTAKFQWQSRPTYCICYWRHKQDQVHTQM